jgi:aspartate racemase
VQEARKGLRYALESTITMMDESRPRKFGLVTGLGMGAGIFYYRSLVNAHLDRGMSPNILMVHADVRRVMAHAAARETRELAAYLTSLLEQLARGGAQIGTIPAFSPQICAQELAGMTPVPLINLLDVIVAEVERCALRRVAIFGARVTVETKLFGRLQNIDVVTPGPSELDWLSHLYVRIVEEGQVSAEDYASLRTLAHTLIDREQLDAILLAGTDLSFVFNPENTDFPHLDGARTHIAAIIRELAPVDRIDRP